MNPAALGKPGRPRSGASRWHPARRPLGGGFSGLGRLIDLHEAAVLHIVNVAVDRDVLRHQRMITDAHNVVNHASGEVADRMPFDELAIDRARALADVAPAGFAKLCKCASPSARPAYLAGSRRASMQVRMANRRAGGMASLPLSPKLAA